MSIPLRSKFLRTMDELKAATKEFLLDEWSPEHYKLQMESEREKLMILINELRCDNKQITEEDFFKNMITSLRIAGVGDEEGSFHLGVMLNAFHEGELNDELKSL